MLSFLKAPISAQKPLDFPLPPTETYLLLQGENQEKKTELLAMAQKKAQEKGIAHRLYLHPGAGNLPFALYIEEEETLLLDANYVKLPNISGAMHGKNAVYLSVDAKQDTAGISKLILALLFP